MIYLKFYYYVQYLRTQFRLHWNPEPLLRSSNTRSQTYKKLKCYLKFPLKKLLKVFKVIDFVLLKQTRKAASTIPFVRTVSEEISYTNTLMKTLD